MPKSRVINSYPCSTYSRTVLIEKGKITICYAERGADRPKTFELKEGEKTVLLMLKRMKKE